MSWKTKAVKLIAEFGEDAVSRLQGLLPDSSTVSEAREALGRLVGAEKPKTPPVRKAPARAATRAPAAPNPAPVAPSDLTVAKTKAKPTRAAAPSDLAVAKTKTAKPAAKSKPVVRGAEKAVPQLRVRPSPDDVHEVMQANTTAGRVAGNKTRNISELKGGVTEAADDQRRVAELVKSMSSPEGYISRLIVDDAGNVIEGQHRLEALRKMGVTEVPVTEYIDFERGLPDIKSAIASAQPMRSDHVNQLAAQLAEIYHDEGGNLAELAHYEVPSGFEAGWKAGIDALAAKAAPSDLTVAKTKRKKVPAAPAQRDTLPSKYHTPVDVIAKEYGRDIAQRLDGIVPNDAPLAEWRSAADNLAGPEGAARNARYTPEFKRPGEEPIVTQMGRQGLPVRGMGLVEAQHPSNFSVFAPYKTPKDPLATEVVTTPYANLPVRSFDPARLEGARVISLLADKERAGDTILSVDGLPTKVDTQGGPLHAALQEALGGSAVFSNAPGPLTTIRRQIAEALDAGRPVFGVTTTMSPSAVNQTVDMVELLHQMAQSSPIRKADVTAFDDKMQTILPGYAGLLHPEAVLQLQNMTQGQRKAFVRELDNADALAKGFPNVGAARFALTDENLMDVPAGATGYQVVQFGPESLVPANSVVRHRAYPDDIGGTYEGRGPLVPFSTVFSDFTKERRAAGLPAGSDLRSLEFRKPYQDMTPEAYDYLMRYLSMVADPR